MITSYAGSFVPRKRLSLLVLATLVGLASGCNFMAQGQNVEGVRLFQQGNYQAAAQKFQEAIQRDPANADGYYNLASTYHRLGKLNERAADLQQAETLYNQCLDHNPNHEDCYRGLAVLLVETNRSDKAITLVKGWSDQSPTLAAPKIELARLCEEFGNPDQAKNHLRDALVLAPDEPRALAALGKLHEQSGNTAQALAVYQRSLARNQFQPLVAQRVASLQAAGGAGQTITTPGGTRMVTTPGATLR